MTPEDTQEITADLADKLREGWEEREAELRRAELGWMACLRRLFVGEEEPETWI
jgi:hypothetical protein